MPARNSSRREVPTSGVRDGVLRISASRGVRPTRDLSDLVGELSTRTEPFRVRWARHDVRLHRTGTRHLHHPVVGFALLANWIATETRDVDRTFQRDS